MRSEGTTDWRELSLYELADYVNGRATKPTELVSDGVPVIKIAELGRGITDTTNRVPAAAIQERHWVRAGDLLFAWSGSVGIHIYRGPTAALNQHIFRVMAKAEVCDQRFLRYLLTAQLPIFERFVASKRTTMGHVTVADLRTTTVRVPSHAEQNRIATILAALDEKIDSNRELAVWLEERSAAEFRARFVDFLNIEEFDEVASGRVPRGWQIETVADLCDMVRNGGTPRRMESDYWKDGTIPWFRTGELNDGFLPRASEQFITDRGLAESNCRLFARGTVLVAIYAAPTVGRLGILDAEGSCNQACTALVPKAEVGYPFLFLTLRGLRQRFNSIASGSAQQNISKALVESAPALRPPAEVLAEFDQLVRPQFEFRAVLGREASTLAKIRDALLPKLISGEIRVPDTSDTEAVIGSAAEELAAAP